MRKTHFCRMERPSRHFSHSVSEGGLEYYDWSFAKEQTASAVMKPHDDAEHIVHRLEAFSDIVIAFSLAQTAINLAVPQHAVDFFRHPIGLFAYVQTFVIVASYWWAQTKVFRFYFQPNRIMVFLNFASLAALALFVFTVQIWLRSGTGTEGIIAAKYYFGLFAITYALLACMFALGTRYRWSRLNAAERDDGIRRTVRVGFVVLGVVVGLMLPSAFLGNLGFAFGRAEARPHAEAVIPTTIVLGYIVGFFLGRIVTRFIPRTKIAS